MVVASFMGPGSSRGKKSRKMFPEGNIVFTSLPTGFSNYPLLLIRATQVTANNKVVMRRSVLNHVYLLHLQ